MRRFLAAESEQAGWRFWLLWVLRCHFARSGSWAWASGAGWALAGFVGAAALLQLAPGIEPGSPGWIVSIGCFGGTAVGLGQLPFMRRAYPRIAPCWVLVSAVAWGVFLPGVVTGAFLARALSRPAR